MIEWFELTKFIQFLLVLLIDANTVIFDTKAYHLGFCVKKCLDFNLPLLGEFDCILNQDEKCLLDSIFVLDDQIVIIETFKLIN